MNRFAAMCALALPAALALVTVVLLAGSAEVWRHPLGFLLGTTWDPVRGEFGALPFVYGTVVTSALALALAVPASTGIAILCAEYAGPRLRFVLTTGLELLAAIPSVVYGLWGVYVVAPWMQTTVEPAIAGTPLGHLPFFGPPTLGLNVSTASIVLAIMILPIAASLSRDVLLAVPMAQREAALALGLTRWETIADVVLPYGRPGLLGAALLALGRALGETMAVTMVIGNQPAISGDLFQAGYTLSAGVANQFAEAVTPAHTSALMALAVVLCGLSLAVNGAARLVGGGLQHGGGE